MEALFELVAEYQVYALTAFVVTVFATPIAARVARGTGVMDFPDQNLKPHARPTPYLGGTAILLGWAVALVVALVRGAVEPAVLVPILLGGLAISVLGLVDDIREVPAKVRLLLGALIIAAVLLLTGAGRNHVYSIFGPVGITVPAAVAEPVSFLISLVIVLGACNSANLIDGFDGLCSGVTAIISLGFFLLASHLALWEYSQTGDPARLVLSIAMFGAAMGFLPMNFNPAKIFMGDAGSILLGFNCGMLIVLFAERSICRWVIGALMIFALPVFDTALAMFRRWRSGRSIFEGDRSHFYDQLVQRGMTVRQSVLVSYLLTIVYVAVGLLTILLRTRYAVLVFLGVCGLTAWVAYITGLTHPDRDTRRGNGSAETETAEAPDS